MINSILYLLQFYFFVYAHSIRIQVKPEIFVRYWPYNGNLDFSKDWSDECDVPCVWTGNPDKADGVFYIIRNNEDAKWAFSDKKVAPISIGGTTEGQHYYSLLTIKTFNKYFDASAFIDLRSDIPWVLKVSSYEEMQSVPRVQNPIKKAVTAIFNCASKNNREAIVVEMSQIVPIDRIGNCLRNAPWPMCLDQPCSKEEVLKRYMFCLVFENGDSPGFVSEKIHQCFMAGSLPVWYGTEDIWKLVPKGSYIDMRDFKSHKALAEYMVRLIKNETLYNSYFEWKKRPLDPDYVTRNKPFWDYKVQCRVCRYVWVKQSGLIWDKATQNATIDVNTSLDSKQKGPVLDQVTQTDTFDVNTSLDSKEKGLVLDQVTQNATVNLNAPLDLTQVSKYANDMKLLVPLKNDAELASSLKTWTILFIISFLLMILVAFMSRVLRMRNYLLSKWIRSY